MTRSRQTDFQAEDIPAAIGLLSRLPVRVNPETARARGARAAWAYPLAGALIGTVAGLAAVLAHGIGLGPGLSAAIALLAGVLATGALHEDGLADTADGFWGGADPARRLEIMKDSRIGTYGVLALILSVLLRWTALAALIGSGHLLFWLIGTAALSRVPMVVTMQAVASARDGGLSAAQGQPGQAAVWGALGLGAIIGLLAFGAAVFIVGPVLALAAWGLARLAIARIGGQTGDVLGAQQQVAEIAILATLAAAF